MTIKPLPWPGGNPYTAVPKDVNRIGRGQKGTIAVLMERAPGQIDLETFRRSRFVPESMERTTAPDPHQRNGGAFGCVLVRVTPFNPDILAQIQEELRAQFDIDHATIQMEEAVFGEAGSLM